jgi:hypothetical protein
MYTFFIPLQVKRAGRYQILTRKNPPAHMYGFTICLSDFDRNYFRIGRTEWAQKMLGHLDIKVIFVKKFVTVLGPWTGPGKTF